MTEPSPRTDADRGVPPGMPRWVKVTAMVVGLLVLLFVIGQVTGVGGEHGPGRHLSGPAAPVGGPTVEDLPAAAQLG